MTVPFPAGVACVNKLLAVNLTDRNDERILKKEDCVGKEKPEAEIAAAERRRQLELETYGLDDAALEARRAEWAEAERESDEEEAGHY